MQNKMTADWKLILSDSSQDNTDGLTSRDQVRSREGHRGGDRGAAE